MSAYGSPPAQPTTGGGSGLGLPTIIAYVAGGLGVLDFIWGFLDWFPSSSGYSFSGGASVGLALAAGLWAAGHTLEKNAAEAQLGPVALAVAALLVVFGNLVGQPDNVDTKVGMILALITSLVQAGALVYGWLIAIGKISAPAPKPAAPQGFGGPQGYQPQGQPGAPQFGQPGAPQGYQPQGQPGAPQGYQPQGQPGYGQPQGGQPGYGQPQGQQSPPPPPSGNPYGPPQGGQQH